MGTLSDEKKVDLAFDTNVLRNSGDKYREIATQLLQMATDLDNCLFDLQDSGWTTPAGSAFYELVQAGWEDNVRRYANLLNTLDDILKQAADEYDSLYTNHIETTKLK